MKPNLIFGIDVGTRTTVISYWNVTQNGIATFKLHGEELIPSGYLPEELEVPGGLDVLAKPGVITNFKIDFWKSDNPRAEHQKRLLEWLTRLYLLLEKQDGLPIDQAAFCFTYPAQRNRLEPLYRELVIRAGFPGDRLVFLDEPTAAVYGHMVEDKDKKSPIGKGLILDVGAGTTDYTIVDMRGGEAGMVVLDTSSISVAGNACTRKLRLLLPEGGLRDQFDHFVKDKSLRADRYKEEISDYYNDGNDDALSWNVKELGIKLRSESRAQFDESVREEWESISREISSRLKAARLSDEDLKFVIPCGGGALHSGLRSYLNKRFGSKVVPTPHPQLIVSRGAAYFGRSRFVPENLRLGTTNGHALLPVSHVLDRDVYIHFPAVTRQENIFLLRKGQVVPLKQPLSGAVPVTLDSNILFPEGPVHIYVGELSKKVVDLDIEWSESEKEVGNHPGTLDWEFKPEVGQLSVTLKLDNVKLNYKGRIATATVNQIVASPGEFTRGGSDNEQ